MKINELSKPSEWLLTPMIDVSIGTLYNQFHQMKLTIENMATNFAKVLGGAAFPLMLPQLLHMIVPREKTIEITLSREYFSNQFERLKKITKATDDEIRLIKSFILGMIDLHLRKKNKKMSKEVKEMFANMLIGILIDEAFGEAYVE